ncbi:Pr6Pr family membrane protein [Streptomyces vinaceus]|uniref:Pr6Pr family membrane protein n=1 Tax=Streptomyces vinaceus TaxID=1960 RepID=UPI00381615F3
MIVRSRIDGYARVGLALVALAALAATLERAIRVGEGAQSWISYFTNLSNMLGAYVLFTDGVAVLRGTRRVPGLVRGAATLYLLITGAVYWTLLTGTMDATTVPWANDVVHAVIPAAFLADWLIRPPTHRVPWAKAQLWMAFPLLYLAFSLLRGPSADWYPYDFLDPRGPGGYAHVLLWSVIMTAAFAAALALLVLWANLARANRRPGPRPPAPGSDDLPGGAGTSGAGRHV